MFTVGCACKIASNNGITCSFVSASNFLDTFSMINCFCEIGSVETFSINVSCIICPLSIICVILNSFVADTICKSNINDLSLTN